MQDQSPTLVWHRIYKLGINCPVCGKPDWCTVSKIGICCMRVPSDRQLRNGGWLHPWDIAGGKFSQLDRLESKPDPKPKLDVVKLYRYYLKHTRPDVVRSFAAQLGLPALALQVMNALVMPGGRGLVFPMRDHMGNITGYRLRYSDGRKVSVRGSREGLFIPMIRSHAINTLFVAEGPTDTAAAVGLGLDVVGRASCVGQVRLLINYVRVVKPQQVVFIADADEPGINGARNAALQMPVPARVIVLPTKDVREYYGNGGRAEYILKLAEHVPVLNTGRFIRRSIRTLNENPDELERYVETDIVD